MKKLLIIFSVLISLSVFGKTTIVNSKTDNRLLAFTDSSECYKFGLWQQENIKKIKCSNDGRIFFLQGLEYQKQIGKYTTRAFKIGKPVFLFDDSEGQHFWSIGFFKKPVDTVLYKPETPEIAYSKNKTESSGICMPSGKIMSKDDFILRYGKETFDRLIIKY